MYAVLVLLAATATGIGAENAGIFYPYGTDQGDSEVPPEDAGSSQVNMRIATGFPFMYDNQSTAFVSKFTHSRVDTITQIVLA